jgi:transposase
MAFENDTKKVEKALKKYEEKKNAALVLLAEIDMLEKMEDVKEAELWRRQSMKEKLVSLERQRKELKELITSYVQKHGEQGDPELQRYSDILDELEKDKFRH